MQLFQCMKMAALSASQVTLGKFVSGAPAAAGDGECHPKYLNMDSMVINLTNSNAGQVIRGDFWACSTMWRVEITRLT